MALHGDLSTLDLADLLQSLALHGRTGTLTVAATTAGAEPGESRPREGAEVAEHLYFKDGKLTLYGSLGRPKLVEVLTACGLVSEEQLETARTQRKGSRRSLGETLVAQEVLSQEQLAKVASSRLLDDSCELIGSGHGAFRFEEGSAPRGLFDPEERRLQLELAPGLLLLEAARRSDHWQLIKSRIPSGSGHYVLRRAPRPGAIEGDPELCAALLERLDGTRSVNEVLARFPHRRFDSYQILANLCDARAIRVASADDMARLARAAGQDNPALAQKLVTRGLEVQPDHVELLDTFVELAEARGDVESAIDALKMLAHMRLGADDREGARAVLERAKQVDPSDRAVWQKSLTLAIEEERLEDAIGDGRRLAELFQAAGLHKRACSVFEQLVELDPDEWEFRSRLAHSRGDCGELERAVDELTTYGRKILSSANYEDARRVFLEVHELDPAHAEAERTISDIDTGKLQRLRLRRKRAARRLGIALLCLSAFGWVSYETVARRAYREAIQTIHQTGLFEERRYQEAGSLLAAVQAAYPFSTTGLWDVPADLDLLAEKSGPSIRSLEAPGTTVRTP